MRRFVKSLLVIAVIIILVAIITIGINIHGEMTQSDVGVILQTGYVENGIFLEGKCKVDCITWCNEKNLKAIEFRENMPGGGMCSCGCKQY